VSAGSRNSRRATDQFGRAGGLGHRVRYGLVVLSVEAERITGIVGFPERPDLFERCGLPAAIAVSAFPAAAPGNRIRNAYEEAA